MRISPRTVIYVFSLACALTALFSLLDILLNREMIGFGDVATEFVEMLVLSTAMIVSSYMVTRLGKLESETKDIRTELASAANARKAWRDQSEQLIQGLSAAVANQFDAWGLTDAESEVASLILKGTALKDIAALRNTSEATIRQQAQSVYRKSGLGNRSELAAYFLEDLFDVAGARASLMSGVGTPH